MLLWFVVLYLLLSVGIGLYASTRVHNARDFVVAGRNLPLPVVTATVFATWFGAETVLGISSTFLDEGLGGVVADPFGASMCLILAGLFFAPRLYRMNLLTLGDFYRVRFNRWVELVMSICIMLSYLGWVSAQVTALGLVFNIITGGGVSQETGMVIGISIVLAYTLFGGMWSVALLDFVQMTVIMSALLLIAVVVSGEAGGAGSVIDAARTAGRLHFFPDGGADAWIAFVGAGVTMMLGSIPQQDVFQRMTSAKTERIAVVGSVLGGCLYFMFAFIPMFLAYSATLIDPNMVAELKQQDSQLILPTLVLQHAPIFAQVLFFGALLSAIMSTASATLLAPSVMFSENILRQFRSGPTSDRQLLRNTRIILFLLGGVVLWFALDSESTIFQMVEDAYEVTLAGAFVPLAFGLFWKRANNQGATLSIVLGIISWQLMKHFQPDSVWPPQLVGLLASAAGMVTGSLLPGRMAKTLPQEPEHAVLHHHAASHTGHVADHPHRHTPHKD